MTDLCCWTQEGRDCVFPAALNWKEEGEAETVRVEQGFSVDTCGSKRTSPQDDSTRMASTRARTIALHEMANYYGQGDGSQPAGGGKGYDPGKGKEKDGKGKDKGKAKGKEGVAGNSPRRRMAAQGQWFQRCDGWCDRVSPPLDVSGPATKSRIYVSLSILVRTCAESAPAEKRTRARPPMKRTRSRTTPASAGGEENATLSL
jgi:hypothetical protein